MDTTIRERRIPPAELGPMLNAARMRAGLRGREAARLLDTSPGYLIDLEIGRRCPSLTMAHKLAEVLALTDDERADLFAYAVADAGADSPWRRSA